MKFVKLRIDDIKNVRLNDNSYFTLEKTVEDSPEDYYVILKKTFGNNFREINTGVNIKMYLPDYIIYRDANHFLENYYNYSYTKLFKADSPADLQTLIINNLENPLYFNIQDTDKPTLKELFEYRDYDISFLPKALEYARKRMLEENHEKKM